MVLLHKCIIFCDIVNNVSLTILILILVTSFLKVESNVNEWKETFLRLLSMCCQIVFYSVFLFFFFYHEFNIGYPDTGVSLYFNK